MKTVGILLFDDIELRTFADALTLFSAATDAAGRPLFRIVLLAHELRTVTCEGGLRVQPQSTIQRHPPLDVLIIPGALGRPRRWSDVRAIEWIDTLVAPAGKGIRRERHNAPLLNWIREQNRRVELLIGICTGAVLLAECGLLNGRRATVPASVVAWMRERYPLVSFMTDVPLVEEGHIVTASGRNCAFDASSHVVAKVYGALTALSAASRLDPCGKCLNRDGLIPARR